MPVTIPSPPSPTRPGESTSSNLPIPTSDSGGSECRSCIPLDCVPTDPFGYYTIDGPLFQFVLNCPPGSSCANANSFSMTCCGDVLSVDLSGMPFSQRNESINNIVQQCIQKMSFCGGTTPNLQLFFNRAQEGIAYCPDGSAFIYWVPAGIVATTSQSSADSTARTIAQSFASIHRVCLNSTIPTEFCSNSVFSKTVTAFGRTVLGSGNVWRVVSGTLPTGLSLVAGTGPTLTISGTPTVGGTFSFVIGVTTSAGDYQTKSFTICIVDISPATPLTAGTVSTAYTVTFSATSCATTPLSWRVASGTLPTGLTLNETTGVLSGTPTVAGTYNFQIVLQTAAT